MTTTARPATTVPILMYHSVARTTNPRYERFAIAPELLREHLDVLADGGWTTVTAADFVRACVGAKEHPVKPVVLTFDDAFSDFHSVALPLLQERGQAATLFIPTGRVGDTSRWMTFEGETERPLLGWSQLEEIATCGIECGAHSHTHAQLDRLSPWRLAAEVRRPREVLEERLQQEARTFSYPFGYHTAQVRRAVVAAGYTGACAVGDFPATTHDDVFVLPRLTIPGGLTAADFAERIASSRGGLARRRERTKAVLWRSARRYGLETTVLERLNS